MNRRRFKEMLPYFLLGAALILAYRMSGELGFLLDFVRWTWGVLSPFFYGFILAFIVNIPIGGIQKLYGRSKNKFILRKQRLLSILTVGVITLGITAAALSFIIPAIVNSVTLFVNNFDDYWHSVVQFLENFNELELFGLHIDEEFIRGLLGGIFANFSLDNLAQPLNVIIGAGMAVFNGVIAFIASIYILFEKEKFKRYLNKLMGIFLSNEAHEGVKAVAGNLNRNFRQYIHTQTIDGLILGTMATIVLFLVGSPFALLLGIMLGIVNYIPYFGSIFGTIVAVIVVAFTQDMTMALIAAAALFLVQQIDANIVQPKLMSGSFSLSPLLVIISITVGGAIAGIFGMIVAIPVLAVLKDIFDGIIDYYEDKKIAAEKAKENGRDEVAE